MTVLLRLDRADLFSVFVNGELRASIKKRGQKWCLSRVDRENASDYLGVDVTPWIFQPAGLEAVIELHLRDG